MGEEHTSCQWNQGVEEEAEGGHLGGAGAALQAGAEPWTECPSVGGVVPRMQRAVEAAAKGAGCRCPDWTWWPCSVAMAALCWLPCCWLEGEAGLAVAMAAGAQQAEVVAGCSEEAGEVASCPSGEEADPWGVREVLVPGPLEGVGAASRVGACRWDWGASEVPPYWESGEGSCVGQQVLRAYCGSSCSQWDWSSSRGGGLVVAGCYWGLRPWDPHQGCWHVPPQRMGPEPLPAQP